MCTVDKSGYIYALECDGEIKLGKAKKSVEQRRKAIQTGRSSPVKIKYRLYVQDHHKAETFIKNVFIKYRKSGEWFKLDAEGIELLRSIFEQTLDNDTLKRTGLIAWDSHSDQVQQIEISTST